MKELTRRDFLKMGTMLAAGAGLATLRPEVLAQGLEKLFARQVKVLWLQGQSCSGCSVSLLNADNPFILEVVTDLMSLVFHQTISAAQGDMAMKLLDEATAKEDYILVVEGSVPTGMPEACMIGGRPFGELLLAAAKRARYVVGVGTCATYGGMPAAEGNVTGAVGVMDYLKAAGMETKGFVVNCPSCPAHPDAIVGTLAYLAGAGYPEVHPELLTPKMYYAHSTHDDCPRYHYYAKHIFAEKIGDQQGCLFKLGCLGMLSYTECPRRQWNSGVNWCVRAAAPCIGCSHPQFGKRKDFPFYRLGERQHGVAYREEDRKGGRA